MLGGCTPVGSCRCVAPCPPPWTSHGVTEHPHAAHPVLTQGTEPSPRWSRQHPGTGVSADAGGKCLLGSVGWVWPCKTPAGLQPGLALAPSIPHPHQLCRHHPRDVATGPVDVFLVAASQQMPKGLSSWGYQKRGPLHGADSVWPISGEACAALQLELEQGTEARLPQAPGTAAQGQGLRVNTLRASPEGNHLGRSLALLPHTTAGSLHARAAQPRVGKRRMAECQ